MNAPISKSCVRLSRFLLASRYTIFVFVLIGFAVFAPLAFAQPDPSIFDQRRYVPQETPRPEVERTPPSKPIPKVVLIAGAAVLLLVSGILLAKSVRTWRPRTSSIGNIDSPRPVPLHCVSAGTDVAGTCPRSHSAPPK